MNLPPRDRRSSCAKCGKVVADADDLTAVHKAEGKRDDIKNKVEDQGTKVDKSLKQLGLAMHMKKTKFITAMNYQRRSPVTS